MLEPDRARVQLGKQSRPSGLLLVEGSSNTTLLVPKAPATTTFFSRFLVVLARFGGYSTKLRPKYHDHHPSVEFDLFHIDGGHQPEA